MDTQSLRKLGLVFVAIMVPFLALTFYVASVGIKNFPSWARWVFPAYFVFAILLLSMAILKVRKAPQADVSVTAPTKPADSHPGRPIKRLLIIYILLFPLAVVGVFVQREVPIRFALLGLIVAALVMVSLWSVTKRVGSTYGGSGDPRKRP